MGEKKTNLLNLVILTPHVFVGRSNVEAFRPVSANDSEGENG